MRLKILQGLGILMVAALVLAGCGGSEDYSTDTNNGMYGGTGISNMFSSPAEMGVGDLMAIELEGAEAVTVDFRDVEGGAQFILALGSYNYSGSGSTIQLSAADESLPEVGALVKGMYDEDSLKEPDIDEIYGPDEIMSAWLRASESTLPDEGVEIQDANDTIGAKALNYKAVSVGDTETFRVLSSLSSTTSYVNVDASAKCVGENVVFYVDNLVSSSVLSTSDIDELCGNFDVIAGEEQDLLGDSSDVDGDGKVHVLMTKQINALGAMGGGIITGYFYAGDLYTKTSSNPVSNERELIYTMVPDPNGMYGTAVSHDFSMSNLLPAVLPHEFQHVISYNQHVFEYDSSPEENWLNEGMSHFMEDYMGVGLENPSRYAMFLSSPSTYGFVTQSSPNLMERGAAYLFLRFLYEQSENGEEFLRSLLQTSNRGVANIENAFAGSSDLEGFSQMMSRWTVALVMTNRGISQDSRYIYRQRVTNSLTGNWEGVCLECSADDNRGTELTGVNLNQYYGYHTSNIDASAVKFFNITTLPNEMTLQESSGEGSFGILIRTQ